MAESLSFEYRHQQAAAKEAAEEIKAAVYIRNLNRIEHQPRLFRNISSIENKLKGGSTNKVNITKENGEVMKYHKREDMENEIAISNESKWY